MAFALQATDLRTTIGTTIEVAFTADDGEGLAPMSWTVELAPHGTMCGDKPDES